MAKSAGGGSSAGPLITVGAYVLLMGLPVRLALRALSARVGFTRQFALTLSFVLLSSGFTESLGIQALFGAFLAGVVWPHQPAVIDEISRRLEPVAMAVVIPMFFSYTGIRTHMGLLTGELWIYALAVIALAVAGKTGGAFREARLTGFVLRDSLALGCLLNTRGLVELIVLNMGLDWGVLSPALFSIMALMALATTMMAAPALALILPEGYRIERLPVPAHALSSKTFTCASSAE
jgi:Kef-type K+ transport system membrane component KefB